MLSVRRFLHSVYQVWPKFDPKSLGVRLTFGVAIVSALGLGGVAVWISWRMQYLLVATHKHNIQYIADRLPHDIEIYSDMMPLETGAQKAIDNLTTPQTLLWVKNPQNKLTAQSNLMKLDIQERQLLNLAEIPPSPELQYVNGRYWLLCATDLTVKDVELGKIFIAQDITGDQTLFLRLMSSLSLASLLAILSMSVILAWYVRRSLLPLKRISQLAEKISPEQLAAAHLELENPPSEVKQLAQTLEATLIRLGEAWEHQRQLMSNVSHELRTPLTIVSGYLQSTLRRSDNLTVMQREALEIASSEASRTVQLLADLLDLARADNDRLYFSLEPICLNDWLSDLQSMIAHYRDRKIQVNLPKKSLIIRADNNRLKQVLLNLLDNAVNYSEKNSPITVTLNHEQQTAKIRVSDRGIGIPLAQQSRIFERFYRVDDDRSRASGGTGLGLSIVKTLVSGMGGTISLISQPKKGTTFTVSFPLCHSATNYSVVKKN